MHASSLLTVRHTCDSCLHAGFPIGEMLCDVNKLLAIKLEWLIQAYASLRSRILHHLHAVLHLTSQFRTSTDTCATSDQQCCLWAGSLNSATDALPSSNLTAGIAAAVNKTVNTVSEAAVNNPIVQLGKTADDDETHPGLEKPLGKQEELWQAARSAVTHQTLLALTFTAGCSVYFDMWCWLTLHCTNAYSAVFVS